MINRRVLIFGLIALLVLTVLTWGTKLVTKKIAKTDDEIEIIMSDENVLEIVEEDGMRKTVFYFQNKEGFLVPVMKRIPWEEGIARTTLNNMIDTPELRESLSNTGLIPLIPSGTAINGITIDPDTGLCKVDFSEELLNKESIRDEENLIKGVVYTLTEFPAVKEVKILVEGKVLPNLKNGAKLEATLTRENINLLGNIENSRSKVVVYYKGNLDSEFEYFVPVTIPTIAPEPNVYTALDLLFEGPPSGTELSTDIPSGVNFQGVEIKDGTAYIDIKMGDNSEMKEASLTSIIKNIGLTLSEFKEIQSVELLVDGEIINTAIPVFANEY